MCHTRALYNVRSSIMERRKDNKGKVLKEGESQRKDGRYQYRWTDSFGKRHTIYGTTLFELREKEEEAKEMEREGISPVSKSMKVVELVSNYATIHRLALKPTSAKNIDVGMNIIKMFPFSQKSISEISVTEAKYFMKELYENGYSFGSINNIKGLLRPSFELACDDNLIQRNPFSFTLSKVIPRAEYNKKIISEEQYNRLIAFCRTKTSLERNLDEIIILHETGLRVSEFCGLTLKDIDMNKNLINVNHQLVIANRKRAIQTPKTKSGVRIVPMSADAKTAFAHLIKIRRPVQKNEEPIIDGCSGFLQLSLENNPRSAVSIEANLKKIVVAYNKAHPEDEILSITPHSLRHMFCTRLVESGMNIKAVQYLMGHSNVGMTLNIYSHVDEKKAIQDFLLLQDSKLSSNPKLRDFLDTNG